MGATRKLFGSIGIGALLSVSPWLPLNPSLSAEAQAEQLKGSKDTSSAPPALSSAKNPVETSIATSAPISGAPLTQESQTVEEIAPAQLLTPRFSKFGELSHRHDIYEITDDQGNAHPTTIQKRQQYLAMKLLRSARPLRGAILVADLKSQRLISFAQFNRSANQDAVATQLFPTASVFKLVTTAALLENFLIKPETQICFRGGDHRLELSHTLLPTGPEPVQCEAFKVALGFSHNAVFAQVASRKMKPSQLYSMSEALGFNQIPAGSYPWPQGEIQALQEAKTPAVDRAASPTPSNSPDNSDSELLTDATRLAFANRATGFEGTSLSPWGALQLVSTIALKGSTPTLEFTEPSLLPSNSAPLPPAMSTNTAHHLSRMMEGTVHGGTASKYFSDEKKQNRLGNLRIAAKTGTLSDHNKKTTVTWFVGFAPARAPQYAFAILLENGDVWRQKAVELGPEILSALFYPAEDSTTPPPKAELANSPKSVKNTQ